MANLTYGLSSIEVGEVSQDGTMPEQLQTLGQTFADTCKFLQEDGEVSDLFCEELDEPVLTIRKAGKSTLSFSLMNPDAQILKNVLGGEVTNGKWDAPTSIQTLEKAVRVTPKQGFILNIPRALIKAKINGEYSKKNVMMIEIAASVLSPATGKAPYSFEPKATV